MGRGGGHKRGVPLSASAKKKISDALRGKKHPHKGHAMTAEARAKIAKAEKGKKHPHKGHPMTSATRAKLSEAAKKRAAARGRAASSPRHVSSRHPGTGHRVHGAGRPVKKGLTLKASLRTHVFHAGTHRLIHVGARRSRVTLIHAPRKHRHRIVIHRHVRAHRVWRKKR